MDYAKHYWRLIERARNRELTGYSERHHVKPRCVGGDNSCKNVVRLTAEEHYVAHQLLVKMYPRHRGLIFAAVKMAGTLYERNNKLYGWLRRKLSETQRGIPGPHLGKKFTDEHRAKLSAAKLGKPARNKGVPMSDEQRVKMSVALKGRKAWNRGKKASLETRAKQSAAKIGKPAHNRGVPMSAEQKTKISATKLGVARMACG